MSRAGSAAVLAMLFLSGCMEVAELPRTTAPELLDTVRNGTAQLGCVSSASADLWLSRAEQAAIYTKQGRWAELSTLLVATNYRSDLTWWFLGRAADGLGSPKAAVGYYETARGELGNGQSCLVSGLCRELDLRKEIDFALAQDKAKAGVKTAAR